MPKGNTEQHPARKLGNDEFGAEEDNVDRNEFAKIDHRPLGRIILGVGEGSAGRSSRIRLSETCRFDPFYHFRRLQHHGPAGS